MNLVDMGFPKKKVPLDPIVKIRIFGIYLSMYIDIHILLGSPLFRETTISPEHSVNPKP